MEHFKGETNEKKKYFYIKLSYFVLFPTPCHHLQGSMPATVPRVSPTIPTFRTCNPLPTSSNLFPHSFLTCLMFEKELWHLTLFLLETFLCSKKKRWKIMGWRTQHYRHHVFQCTHIWGLWGSLLLILGKFVDNDIFNLGGVPNYVFRFQLTGHSTWIIHIQQEGKLYEVRSR